MPNRLFLLILLISGLGIVSCSDPQEPNQNPDTISFFFEVEVEGNKFRQELSADFPDETFPLIFSGGFNTVIDQACISGVCIKPFYVNMLFGDVSEKQPWEQIEMIQVPSGSYTSHNWYGGSDETPTPSEGRVTITKKDLAQRLIQGTFEGEVYKTGTQTPIKIPIKGSFSAKYLQ